MDEKMVISRFCVFCGEPPESKNKEHVLPQWLLSLTGDPKRVVSIGTDYRAGKALRFAWQALVMPACESCNTEFSALESEVKPLIEKLIGRRQISTFQYVTVLDWLDKIRVGLWLNYHVLQGNPVEIKPAFHIKSRMRQKDRFLAIYPVGGQSKGLNAHGVESLAFHREPSAFGLRINDILIVNCSSDYLFSSRCGFPYPSNMKMKIDGENIGLMEVSDFKATKKIKSPIFRFSLCKPSVYLFQPIIQVGVDMGDGKGELEFEQDVIDYLRENTAEGSGFRVGRVYRQYNDRVMRLGDDEMVEFDEIKDVDCVPYGCLVKQIYELQLYLRSLCIPLAENIRVRSSWEETERIIRCEGKYRIRQLVYELSKK